MTYDDYSLARAAVDRVCGKSCHQLIKALGRVIRLRLQHDSDLETTDRRTYQRVSERGGSGT